MVCRACKSKNLETFLDLGFSPVANDYIASSDVLLSEKYFPLKTYVCINCSLVQVPEYLTREKLFRSDYMYFSSVSKSWLEHCEIYVNEMIDLLKLRAKDLVIEVASNDGYLLNIFKKRNIQVLGIEPALSVAKAAKESGIDTIVDFFGLELANNLGVRLKAQLIVANNVLAHVPDMDDFIAGFNKILDPEGVITFEFPHLVNLIKNNQFDTIYHEHYSYLNITSLIPVLETHGLRIFDIKKIETHGGSLRLYVCKNTSKFRMLNSVNEILYEERDYDPRNLGIRLELKQKVSNTKLDLLSELIRCKKSGLSIAAYGAAAKGNTLLNYAGIHSDLIDYVIDLNPHKQGKLLPGSRIPIKSIDILNEAPPDILLILPWNLSSEIKSQIQSKLPSKTRLLRAIPEIQYL